MKDASVERRGLSGSLENLLWKVLQSFGANFKGIGTEELQQKEIAGKLSWKLIFLPSETNAY